MLLQSSNNYHLTEDGFAQAITCSADFPLKKTGFRNKNKSFNVDTKLKTNPGVFME